MHSFSVVVVGCRDSVLEGVRNELNSASVSIEAECSGMNSAVALGPPTGDQKRVYVVNVAAEGLSEVRSLHGVASSCPILALVDSDLPPNVITGVIRAGASQVVTLPIHSEDFVEALDCIGEEFGGGKQSAQTIAVTAAMGGNGATTLAINIANELTHFHRNRCVLLELALGRGVIATYLNIEPRFTTSDILSDIERADIDIVQQALVSVGDRLKVLAAPHRTLGSQMFDSAALFKLIEYAMQMAPTVVSDVPCTFETRHLDVLTHSDHVVVVGEQKVPSVRSLKLLLDALRRAEHTSNPELHVVLNRFEDDLPGFRIPELKELLQVKEIHPIRNDFDNVMGSVNRGQVLRVYQPQSVALEDICKVTARILGIEYEPKLKQKGFLGRLLGK